MTEHHLLRKPAATAYGTGGHDHHRASIERDGLRQSFWSCRLSTRLDRSCEAEPDPLEVLLVKLRERQPVPTICKRGHEGRWDLNNQGRRICLECRILASRRARERRAA